MTRLARVDMDAVAPLYPSDKVAGRVAGRGEHFEFTPNDAHHSDLPIQTRAATPRERNDPNYRDLTGVKVGRLSVLGLAAFSTQENRRWVVRCVCGCYEVKKSKYIRKCISGEIGETHEAMCLWCLKSRKLQHGYHDKEKAAAAAQAIQNCIR